MSYGTFMQKLGIFGYLLVLKIGLVEGLGLVWHNGLDRLVKIDHLQT